MYLLYKTMIPQEHQAWRSASEIEAAAYKHEKQRIQLLDGDALWAGTLAHITASLRRLAALLE